MAKSPRSGENRGRRAADKRRATEEQAAQVSQPNPAPGAEAGQVTQPNRGPAAGGDNGGAATSASKSRGSATSSSLRGVGYAGRVSKEQIAERAYQIYLARGGTHGYDIEDWLQAERELLGQ